MKTKTSHRVLAVAAGAALLAGMTACTATKAASSSGSSEKTRCAPDGKS